MFLPGRLLSDEERYCDYCGLSDILIGEVTDIDCLMALLHEHGLENGSDEYEKLTETTSTFWKSNPCLKLVSLWLAFYC